MKIIIKWLLFGVLFLVLLFSVYAIVSGRTYMFNAIIYNFADIDDYKIFYNDTVKTNKPQPWNRSADFNKTSLPASLDSLLKDLQTIGLVVVRNDSLLMEHYWDGFSDSSYSASFSIAKSITSLLIGAALKEGKIRSIDEPVGTYIPEFSKDGKSKVKIKDLLTMSSGSNWDEAYSSPFSVTTEAYYGNDLYRICTNVRIITTPGTLHSYKSGDTQLLAFVLEKATGKSLSEYASEKLWQPLGAEHAALWSRDREAGHQKAYCCFNSNARDFARIGQLMMDEGTWKGTEIITKEYFERSIRPCMIPDEVGKPCDYYGFQWWLVPYKPGIFYARGILGQYVIVIPSKKIVIVRLGKLRSNIRIQTVPQEVNDLIEWALTL